MMNDHRRGKIFGMDIIMIYTLKCLYIRTPSSIEPIFNTGYDME